MVCKYCYVSNVPFKGWMAQNWVATSAQIGPEEFEKKKGKQLTLIIYGPILKPMAKLWSQTKKLYTQQMKHPIDLFK